MDQTTPNPIDRVLDKLLLWVIPRSVTPNHFTTARIASVPLVAYLLFVGDYKWGLVLFSVFAFTDAIDGALARTRDQITPWGRVMDPLADKLLIGFSALAVVYRLDPIAAIAMAGLEAAIGGVALYHLRAKREIVNPHITGKVKMVLQSLGVIAAILFFLTGLDEVGLLARVLVYFALGLGLISVTVYRSA